MCFLFSQRRGTVPWAKLKGDVGGHTSSLLSLCPLQHLAESDIKIMCTVWFLFLAQKDSVVSDRGFPRFGLGCWKVFSIKNNHSFGLLSTKKCKCLG